VVWVRIDSDFVVTVWIGLSYGEDGPDFVPVEEVDVDVKRRALIAAISTAAVVWVPSRSSAFATWAYSCISPPSWSRRRMCRWDGDVGGGIALSGAAWLSARWGG
jgi:hypothetical protein